jgi:hypothetical protein
LNLSRENFKKLRININYFLIYLKMNFVIIIDTSLSMCQYFDRGYTYLDAAKSAVEYFIKSRELIKNKIKPDKYFLLTTGENNSSNLANSQASSPFSPSMCNVVSSWADSVDHLLFQLKILKTEFSFTNIEIAIQTGLNLINSLRKIGTDKHVHGRLPSKISNSFIMLFTDGGKLNNFKRVLTKSCKVGLSLSSMDLIYSSNKNQNLSPDPSSAVNFSDLYHEPFKWDQSFFSFVLNSNADQDGMAMLKKYSSLIGGSVEKLENFDELIAKMDFYSMRKFIFNKVNINLEINNSVVNLLQQNDIKISGQSNANKNQMADGIKFSISNKSSMSGTFSKSTVCLNVDYKYFKPTGSLIISSSDLIFDRNETLNYKEKWPLPDDFLINKNMKNFPRRKSRPTYVIANEIKFDFNILRSDYDEYEIYDPESEFIIKLLENYPSFTLGKIKNMCIPEKVNSNSSNTGSISPSPLSQTISKITWDVYTLMGETSVSPQSASPKKPFAVLRLIIDSKKLVNNKNVTNDEIPLNEFLLKEKEEYNSQQGMYFESCFKLKLIVLPYNYQEFFSITSSYQKALVTESEFIIQIEKYMKKIPFFYKPFTVQYLEKKFNWKTEENFYKNLDDENLNEHLFQLIKNVLNEDRDRISEINMSYNYNKQMHLNRMSKCCGMHIFRMNSSQSKEKTLPVVKSSEREEISKSSIINKNNFENFLSFCSNLQLGLKTSSSKVQNISNNNFNHKNELPIEHMGNYTEYITTHYPLRSPYVFDYELKEFKGDYFGNPFRRYTADEVGLNSNQIKGKINLDKPNIGINDGESLMVNSSIDNQIHIQIEKNKFKKLAQDDEELSVFPDDETLCLTDESSSSCLYQPDSVKVPSIRKNLQMQLIDDDLILEFISLFNQKDSERHGLKIDKKFEIDMNVIYDWKLKEKMKECKRN